MPKLKVNINNKRGFNNKTNYIGTNTETTNYTNTKNKISYTNDNFNNKEESPLDELNENVKEILYEQNKYEEEKGKKLYEKLKTRYNSFDSNKTKEKKHRKNLSKIKKRNIPSSRELIATPQQISEFDYYLGQAFIKGKFRFLTIKQRENLGYIGELNLFNSINRIKEKQNIIKNKKIEDNKKSKYKISDNKKFIFIDTKINPNIKENNFFLNKTSKNYYSFNYNPPTTKGNTGKISKKNSPKNLRKFRKLQMKMKRQIQI